MHSSRSMLASYFYFLFVSDMLHVASEECDVECRSHLGGQALCTNFISFKTLISSKPLPKKKEQMSSTKELKDLLDQSVEDEKRWIGLPAIT